MTKRLENWIKLAASAGVLTGFVEKKLNDFKKKQEFIPLATVPGGAVIMNKNAVKADGSYDLIINFRGSSSPSNYSNPNAIIVNLEASGPQSENLGSKLLEQQFGNANKVNEIIGIINNHLKKQFPDKNIHRGKLTVSGFSGGGSVVGEIVNQRSKINGGIDNVIINDGLHSDFDSDKMKAILEFAREAQKDPSKKFKLLHTAIGTSGYPSTTETADYLIKQLGLQRKNIQNPEEYQQFGFVPKSEIKDGGLEIVQMYDEPAPYYVDNRADSLGDQHVKAVNVGNPYLFRDIYK